MRPHMHKPTRPGYDWTACLIAIVAAFAVAIPLGLLTYRLTGSGGLMSAVFPIVGIAVSRVVYARVARRGARRIEDSV
jgi:hypothetical protein